MNLFKADFNFLLPDGFSGDIAEALELVAKKLRQERNANPNMVVGYTYDSLRYNERLGGTVAGKFATLVLEDGQPWKPTTKNNFPGVLKDGNILVK